MTKTWVAMTAALLLCSASSAQTPPTECFDKAATQVEYAACLKTEMEALGKQYKNVEEQVMSRMRALDRVQKNKKATQALTDANKAFQTYVKEECELIEKSYGSGAGAGAGAAGLACRINLTRLRMGALQHQFLSAQ